MKCADISSSRGKSTWGTLGKPIQSLFSEHLTTAVGTSFMQSGKALCHRLGLLAAFVFKGVYFTVSFLERKRERL